MSEGIGEVTRLLNSIQNGDRVATDQLLPVVYDELKRLASAKLARENAGQTLQTTGLVHEAYLRLVSDVSPGWETRGHFFAAAAEAMRRILVERYRSKGRLKRGANWQRVGLSTIEDQSADSEVDIEALNEALDDLEAEQPDKAELVKLRYFAGLSVDDAAQVLGISTATAVRRWRYSRAWLADRLTK